MARRSLVLPVLIGLSILAVACTSTPPVAKPTTAPVTGALVAIAGSELSTSLIRFQLSDGTASPTAAPVDPEAVNRGTIAGALGSGGTLLVAANSRSTSVYDVAAGSSDAVRVGPSLDVRARDDPLVAIGAHGAVVATCEGVWILPLPAGARWINGQGRCWAALAPDGASYASTTDGHRVVETPIDGGRSQPLFDLADLRPALGPGTSEPKLIGTPSWGEAGLGFLVRAGDQFAVFLLRPSGELVKVMQEMYANVYRVPRLAWQRTGDLLAIADDIGPAGAVLRVFDPSTSTLSAVSLAPVAFDGIGWSPEGTSIAWLSGAGQLVVVALDGTWLLSRQTEWDVLLSWNGGS